ncbi:uncharacterized protein B0J16DRAFT_404368 [Fusarium flagelliforme]|uniref:Uncharacterized protein n=1 Tax=Fusarium flagelliforme TaxID=2675880 RepID=A0A395MKE4_9HYPO|nr:uncharacterized protein B0J16DRAFT_404368 [Fusarium flagelliforme]KAH7174622.1 hypothetical protein B0J16DRAFT_404368 [Fusarium flagelliforme]RFN48341.1 hypothetical protein FIE12Z_7390 [Fusarium flagelliforme]
MGYNCSFDARGSEVEPYGDIAGPGVIAGFLGTAWLAVIFVLLHYLFVFDPYEDPFQGGNGNNSGDADRQWRANPIDSLVKSIVKKGLERMNVGSSWAYGLEMSILGMCDVQFVTGLGILISGFIDLPKGISAYHFILVTHLAWFSNLTHICGLTVLRQYFHTRPTEKLIRIICMIILAIMLLVAIGPTLFFNWAHSDEGTASLAGTSAICFYNPSRSADWHERTTDQWADLGGSTAFQSGIMSVILLVLSLLSRTIKFHYAFSNYFKRIRNYYDRKRVHQTETLANRGTETSGIRAIVVRRALLYSQVASSLTVRLYSDLVISTLSDLYWLVVSAAWGTAKLFMTKFSATVDENDWTFGQVLPAFLLIGPIATAVKGALDRQINSPQSTINESTTPAEQNASDDHAAIFHDAEHLNEPIEMRRFRQHLSNCLGRNYYDTSTCSWIIPVFCFLCIQILEVTVLMFLELVVQRSSATNALFAVFFLIVIISPTATYLLILSCLFFEHSGTDDRGYLVAFSAFISMVLLGLYSMYPVWGVLYPYSPSGTETSASRIGQDPVILGVSAPLFLMAVLGYTAPLWIFGK